MSQLLSDRRAGVCTLTLNRPQKLNALSGELVDLLLAEVRRCETDGTRLLVLRGNGRNFCAGFDFSEFESEDDASLLLRFVRIEELLQAVYHAPFDTIVFAHGPTMGAGADLVCSCARRVASPDARFRMPGLRFGLILGSRRLLHRVGQDKARQLLAATRTFSAERALELGFVEALHEQEAWEGLIEAAANDATVLDAEVRRSLFAVTTPDTRHEDMSELVRSAARAGLRDRLKAYLETLK